MKLDATQQEIVTSKAKNIIVSAGAGSGKTRVLTERVKYLMQDTLPENIVCITFTNKAANEMKQRLVDIPNIGDAFIGTIHSFANKVFKNSGANYELLTADKEIEIIRGLINKYGKYTTIDDYMKYINLKRDVELGIQDEHIISDTFEPSILYEIDILYGRTFDSETEEYPESLYTVCSKYNIITFDQLLRECSKYFYDNDISLDYLLVDEFQDIGPNEYQFIMSLDAQSNFFVGDDWQSIYKFKGGDVRYFLKLMEDPNWTSYYMTKNYRNAKNILDVAQIVINQADDIIDKSIEAVRDVDGSVEISTKQKIFEYLSKIVCKGDYKDWFILVRSNKDIVTMSHNLTSLNIPYVTFKQSNQDGNNDISMKMNLDAVKLLTIHAAKGLESKNVLLYGNFPIRQKSYLKNSDERKVLYVGITRAEDTLIILN